MTESFEDYPSEIGFRRLPVAFRLSDASIAASVVVGREGASAVALS